MFTFLDVSFSLLKNVSFLGLVSPGPRGAKVRGNRARLAPGCEVGNVVSKPDRISTTVQTIIIYNGF